MESPDAYVDNSLGDSHFCMALCSFGPPFHTMVGYHLETGGMPLHDAAEVNRNRGATTVNQELGRFLVYG